MPALSKELSLLRGCDPDIALILDTYADIERLYAAALQAMGTTPSAESHVRNSADVVVAITPWPTAFPRP